MVLPRREDALPMSFESRIHIRRRTKLLTECRLPKGFRLMVPRPRQVVMDGQARWAILLAWCPDGQDEMVYAHRYEAHIPNDIQMAWALKDFAVELEKEGIQVVLDDLKPNSVISLLVWPEAS